VTSTGRKVAGFVTLMALTASLHAGEAAPASEDPFDAEASARALATARDLLRTRCEEGIEAALSSFRAVGERGAMSADVERAELATHLERTRAALLELAERHPDEEEWAEDRLVELESLAFWLRRMSPLDLEDDDEGGSRPAMPAEPEVPVFTLEELPEGVPPPTEASATDALAAARATLEAGELERALYLALEGVRLHTDRDADTGAALDQLITDLRGRDELDLVEWLSGRLEDDDPLWRGFAASELGATGRAEAAEPLARALGREEDETVLARIQAAFARLPRRHAAEELARLRRSRDVETRRRAIVTLGEQVGGNRGALALADLAGDEEPDLMRLALAQIVGIGGSAASRALGETVGDRRSGAKLVLASIESLTRLGGRDAAAALVGLLDRRGKYRHGASDAVVALGGDSIVPLVLALGKGRLRAEATECLQRISGRSYGATPEKWKEWYREWLTEGQPALPCRPRE
jgi:hypothetical protein